MCEHKGQNSEIAKFASNVLRMTTLFTSCKTTVNRRFQLRSRK